MANVMADTPTMFNTDKSINLIIDRAEFNNQNPFQITLEIISSLTNIPISSGSIILTEGQDFPRGEN